MAQDNKVVSLRAQKVPGRFSLPASLVRLRDVSGQSLKSVLSGFFDKADDALFELADKAGIDPGDHVVITVGMPLPARGRTNTVHVSRLR